VLKALNEVRVAQNALYLNRERHVALMQRRRGVLTSPHLFPDRQEQDDMQTRYDKSRKEAWAKDEALIKVIREELRSRPEAAMLPAEVPAKHRGLWRSHRN
jgi:hypothetical protein